MQRTAQPPGGRAPATSRAHLPPPKKNKTHAYAHTPHTTPAQRHPPVSAGISPSSAPPTRVRRDQPQLKKVLRHSRAARVGCCESGAARKEGQRCAPPLQRHWQAGRTSTGVGLQRPVPRVLQVLGRN